MQHIADEPRTLENRDHEAWAVLAMDAGMAAADLNALARVRLRLMGAAAVADEILGERATVECVIEVLRQVDIVARPHPNFYW